MGPYAFTPTPSSCRGRRGGGRAARSPDRRHQGEDSGAPRPPRDRCRLRRERHGAGPGGRRVRGPAPGRIRATLGEGAVANAGAGRDGPRRRHRHLVVRPDRPGAVIVVASDDRRLAGSTRPPGDGCGSGRCRARADAGRGRRRPGDPARLREAGRAANRRRRRYGPHGVAVRQPVYGATSTPLWFVVAPGGEIWRRSAARTMSTARRTATARRPQPDRADLRRERRHHDGDVQRTRRRRLHQHDERLRPAHGQATVDPSQGERMGRADHDDLLPAPGLLVGRTSWDDTYSDWPMPYFVSVIERTTARCATCPSRWTTRRPS